MEETGFELFEHTADIGIRIRASSLEELLGLAAAALYQCIGTVAAGSEAGSGLELDLRAEGRENLLRDFLAELLFYFESKQLVAKEIELGELTSSRLSCKAKLFVLDQGRSVFYREVKAVTYHQLSLTETGSPASPCYEANVILDI